MIGRSIVNLAGTRGFLMKRYFSLTAVRTAEQVRNHQPNNLEKRFLVWTGKYKTVEEVPNLINADVMERARNRIRIRLANIMMALTVVGCILMVLSGKAAAKRGDTVQKQNLDWHKQYNESHPKKE